MQSLICQDTSAQLMQNNDSKKHIAQVHSDSATVAIHDFQTTLILLSCLYIYSEYYASIHEC